MFHWAGICLTLLMTSAARTSRFLPSPGMYRNSFNVDKISGKISATFIQGRYRYIYGTGGIGISTGREVRGRRSALVFTPILKNIQELLVSQAIVPFNCNDRDHCPAIKCDSCQHNYGTLQPASIVPCPQVNEM